MPVLSVAQPVLERIVLPAGQGSASRRAIEREALAWAARAPIETVQVDGASFVGEQVQPVELKAETNVVPQGSWSDSQAAARWETELAAERQHSGGRRGGVQGTPPIQESVGESERRSPSG